MSTHLCLGLPRGFFLVGFPVNIMEAVPSSFILATCRPRLNLLELIALTVLSKGYKLGSFSLWSFLHSPYSSLFGPNIRLRILFSNTHSLRSSTNVSQTYAYITTGNIIVLYFYFLILREVEKTKVFELNNNMNVLP